MNPADGAPKPPTQTLLKPQQVASLPFITDPGVRERTHSAVSQFWSAIETSPPESDHYKQAVAGLSKLSANVMQQYNKWRAQNPQAAAAQRPQSQGQPPGQTQHPPQQLPQAQPSQNAAPATQQQPALPPAILEHLKQFQFVNPKEKPRGTPEGEKWLTQAKNYYGSLLLRMERSKANVAQLEKAIEQRKAQNAQIPPEVEQRRAQAVKEYEQIKQDATNFRTSQAKAQQQQPVAPQNAAQVKVDGSGTQSSAGQQSFNMQIPGQQNSQQSAQRPPSTGSNPAIDVVARSAPNQTRPTMNPATTQQPQQMTQPAPSSYPPPQPSAQAISQQQPPPQSATATRPPLNTQIPPQVGQTAQSAVSAQPTGPRTLSHQEAISQAQRSYSDQRSTPQSSAGAYPQVGNRETPVSGNKYHMPKQLPERSTTMPVPVPMGASRPTLSGPANGVGGMMGQPPIEKQAGMVFVEGEGSGGILSKNKLQELVREVGGPDESLTPPVEDILLSVADEFIDNVIISASRLAKLRGQQDLTIRDIQMVLERNHNIRIPGYSLDETRVVRKFQPAPGWTQKMNAVQAAKVMGGKMDI